jgi:hypothetical protein
LSRVIGRSVTRLPVALKTALAIAAGTPTMTTSARPLTPSGSAIVSSAGRNVASRAANVGVDGHEVIGHVGVDDAAVSMVEVGAFQQCHPDAAYHAADDVERDCCRGECELIRLPVALRVMPTN